MPTTLARGEVDEEKDMLTTHGSLKRKAGRGMTKAIKKPRSQIEGNRNLLNPWTGDSSSRTTR